MINFEPVCIEYKSLDVFDSYNISNYINIMSNHPLNNPYVNINGAYINNYKIKCNIFNDEIIIPRIFDCFSNLKIILMLENNVVYKTIDCESILADDIEIYIDKNIPVPIFLGSLSFIKIYYHINENERKIIKDIYLDYTGYFLERKYKMELIELSGYNNIKYSNVYFYRGCVLSNRKRKEH